MPTAKPRRRKAESTLKPDPSDLLEAIPEPSLVLTSDGRILASNQSARAALRSAISDGRLSAFGAEHGSLQLSCEMEDAEGLRSFLCEAAGSRSPIPGHIALSTAGSGSVRFRCTASAVRSAETPSEESLLLLRLATSGERASKFVLLNRKIEQLNSEVHRRRKVESELRESRLLLEETQKIAGIGRWEWDLRSGDLTWSEELFRIYGLDPAAEPPTFEEYLGLIAPEDRERVRVTIASAASRGGPFSFDHDVVRPDGVRRAVHGRGEVIRAPDGTVVRMRGSGQDITERKRREDQWAFLVEAGKELSSSLDYGETLEGLVRLTVPEICTWCAVDILEPEGMQRVAVAHRDSEKERMAREFYSRHPPDFSSASFLGSIMREGAPRLYPQVDKEQFRDVARDEEHHRFLVSLDIHSAMVVPMETQGRSLGVITFTGDRSKAPFDQADLSFAQQLASLAALAIENARAYRSAQQAVRAREEIASIVSHDVRGPLGAIAGAAQLLRDLPLPAEKQEEQLAVIIRSADQIDRLTRDLLDLQRLEAGRLSIRRSEEPVDAVLDSVEKMWRTRVARKSLTLSSWVEPGLPSGWFDRDRIEQVLNNLVGNAVKFTPPGGHVCVSVERSGDDLRFEVRDTGPGLPEDHFPHLFERFWRGEETDDGGTGLGLAIAKGLVEAHGGRIQAGNGDSGAVFTFWIPRGPSSTPESSERGSAA